MLFKAPLACEQAVYSRHKLASANHRDFLMELAFQVIYISLDGARSIIGEGGDIHIYSCSQTVKTIDFKIN